MGGPREAPAPSSLGRDGSVSGGKSPGAYQSPAILLELSLFAAHGRVRIGWAVGRAGLMVAPNPARVAAIIALILSTSACTTYASTLPAPIAPYSSAVVPPSATPDPCSPENLPDSVQPLNEHMRQFDDLAVLAANILQTHVIQVVSAMRAIRSAAGEYAAPACLEHLKALQLLYMDRTLETLVSFQAGADAPTISRRILLAREYHEQYAVELARMLGKTLTPSALTPKSPPTP